MHGEKTPLKITVKISPDYLRLKFTHKQLAIYIEMLDLFIYKFLSAQLDRNSLKCLYNVNFSKCIIFSNFNEKSQVFIII